ncbi:MAG: hypothetical protein ACOVQ2_04700, partial [Flavobacterium sp.]
MLNREIDAFGQLGNFIKNYISNDFKDIQNINYENEYIEFQLIINKSIQENGWFTHENIILSLESWAKLLDKNLLNIWLSNYDIAKKSKIIGLVLAG